MWASLKWKIILVGALSAAAGSALTVTVINVNKPAGIECQAVQQPSADGATNTFKRVAPHNTGRDKEY